MDERQEDTEMSRADRLVLLTIARALKAGNYEAALTYSPEALAAAYLKARRGGPF
jgi:hypothetical protein